MSRKELSWKSRLKWAPITIKENMSKDVKPIGPGVYVTDIAKLLRDEGVGCVPVKENNKVIGIITDRDITCRVTANDRNPATTVAKEIMSGDVSCCYEDDLLANAAKVMEKRRVRRLPVLDRNEELVGILTADDLAWHTDHSLLGEVVASVSEIHE
jgi:CBS domain-containing protein